MIREDEILLKNYTTSQLKEILEASFDGRRCVLSAYDKSAYYAIKRFIETYNKHHANNQTSFNDIVKVLTGKNYDFNKDAYFASKVREVIEKNGFVTGLNKETRIFYKNKLVRCKKANPEKYGKYTLSDLISDFVPEATFKKVRSYTHEEILNSLKRITDEKGEVDFTKDEGLRDYLRRQAKIKGTSIEEEIAKTGHKINNIKTRYLISREEHIANILDCVDENNCVVDLSKKYMATCKMLNNLAHKNKCSMNIALNKLLGSNLQEYTYRGIHDKPSKYDLENKMFVGNIPEAKEKFVDIIKRCMREDGVLVGIYNHKMIDSALRKIAEINDITMDEAVKIFVPEAIYNKRHANEMMHQTKEDVIKNIYRFNDGSGCVDRIRKSSSAITSLRKFAKLEGLNTGEFVEKYTDCYFSSSEYEVDYIDYVVSKLISRYGYGGEISGLSSDKPLYDSVKRIKDYFPGGAKESMEETLIAFGFSYKGVKRDSKFTEQTVREMLYSAFGNKKEIDSLYEHKDVATAVVNYSGKRGKSVKETLEHFGYGYSRENKNAVGRLAGKRMSYEEYQWYKSKNGNKNEEPGDE